jgi:hypothetical protein
MPRRIHEQLAGPHVLTDGEDQPNQRHDVVFRQQGFQCAQQDHAIESCEVLADDVRT